MGNNGNRDEEAKLLNTRDQAFNERGKRTLSKLEQEGLKVQLVGVIKEGRIELDQDSLRELAAKYPNINMMFVALNSPFDPKPCKS
jgi:hypothetical protein